MLIKPPSDHPLSSQTFPWEMEINRVDTHHIFLNKKINDDYNLRLTPLTVSLYIFATYLISTNYKFPYIRIISSCILSFFSL